MKEKCDRQVYILFDRPENNNDKQWLYDIFKLCSEWPVHAIYSKYIVSHLQRSGFMGRIKAILVVALQCLKTIMSSSKGDIIICWSGRQGLFCNAISCMLKKERLMVLMNWLTPQVDKRGGDNLFLRRLAIQNDDCRIIVNSIESKERWLKYLNCEDRNNIFFVPDVYNTSIEFHTPKFLDEKYCFTGGANNRDWELLMRVAEKLPEIKFVCVALKDDFEKKVANKPKNVIVYYNVQEEQYYNLMKKSYLILLPLKDNSVSGLINIIRAAQYGIPCLTKKTKFTEPYYSEKNMDLLLDDTITTWINKVSDMFNSSETEYVEKTIQFQLHIKEEFSPDKVVKAIIQIIN